MLAVPTPPVGTPPEPLELVAEPPADVPDDVVEPAIATEPAVAAPAVVG
jgi:hypothetical protein